MFSFEIDSSLEKKANRNDQTHVSIVESWDYYDDTGGH